MLVLSRQKDQSIIIGDDVVVTVVDIRGDKVRLGIEAPYEIPVHRKEVYEAIGRENYNVFRNYLASGHYGQAWDMFSVNNSLGTREEIDTMVDGLNRKI